MRRAAELRSAVETLQRENVSLAPKAQSFDAAAADLARLRPEFEGVQASKQGLENELDALRVATSEDSNRKAGRIAHLDVRPSPVARRGARLRRKARDRPRR